MTKRSTNNSNSIEERISRIRQLLYRYRKEQEGLIWELACPSSMVIGTFYRVYKTCGKPNCCCKKGKRHGPFPALYSSIGGKRKLKMVRREDVAEVEQKAKAYKRYQGNLRIIRQFNREIDKLLKEIRGYYLEEYE
ncbi:MAG: DUF6788 family protein [Candidatus Edwardsbacteria bacterium]